MIICKNAKKRKERMKRPSTNGNFVIDKIFDHKINRSRRDRCAKAGEPLYHVCWYGYETDDDTFEPMQNLPCAKILSYQQKKKLSIMDSIEQANDG